MLRRWRPDLFQAILALIGVVGLVVSAVSWDQILNDHVRAWVFALLGAFIVLLLFLIDGYGKHLRRENADLKTEVADLKTEVAQLREQPWRGFLTYVDGTRTESLSTPGGGSGHNHGLTFWQWAAVRRIVDETKGEVPDLDERPQLQNLVDELLDDLGEDWDIYEAQSAHERNSDVVERRRNIARFRHGLVELSYRFEKAHRGPP